MKTISVIGAGVMGRGIAYSAALANFNVTLHDISEQSLQNAKEQIEKDLNKSIDRGYANEEDRQPIANIQYTTSLEEAGQKADLVIEAVLEDMALKIEVFQKLDQLCPPHTILATNTSTMSPTEIGAQTKRASQTIAMHFFNPVPRMKLVEVVRGLDTSDETYEKVKQAALQMNKEVVEVNEFPGFVTSRMNCLIGNEAMNMLMEGVASAEDIDKALKLGLNHPMGPLELADLVGLDSRLRNMQYLYETLGEKYRPCPLLTKYVKAGKLGRKSGEGFYKYD
ncbi:3-hydroxybutyryl-CoA dehydrogenase [Solibacillus isronensis B3W22]|uniref:3-hydroxybutyryl-CoA dehydrogenase n=1 Tax=Solibacillus isronensis B3W22 TaxID=1224748 RepID=K1LLP8_9BACL|nr:3-hydroxyacyl-CoA dehydrogenase NAD-binding domain-containing protein [Solibacillus isronensis]EKB45174.1 3-hydroxybutyryl-CoA dehydrogenase [Solibacillus isronensis B3W22]